jgi:hypothetical protein
MADYKPGVGDSSYRNTRLAARETTDRDSSSAIAEFITSTQDVLNDKNSLDVNITNASGITVDISNDAISSFSASNKNVTTSATIINVSGTNLTNRGYVTIQPIDGDIYVGGATMTDITEGTLVEAGAKAMFKVADDTVNIYAISDKTVDCRIFEAVTA